MGQRAWVRDRSLVHRRCDLRDQHEGRNAFEQLITTAENGRGLRDGAVYDISRFSRGGTNETGFYLHRLKMAGVDVVFTADGIPEGDEGELIQGVKSWQARQYSVKLAGM